MPLGIGAQIKFQKSFVGGNWSHATGMSKNALTIYQVRTLRQPAIVQPFLEQLIGAGSVVPDGDRRQRAHSGDAQHKHKRRIGKRKKDIVAKFVLGYHVHLVEGETFLLQIANSSIQILQRLDLGN
jgi:hypothetical protein